MEPRLRPVNALVALCTHGDVYPSALAEAGYALAGLEVPVASVSGSVCIDVVLFNSNNNVIIAAEAKSGANIAERQAQQYGQLQADPVIQAASINVKTKAARQIQPLYCCLDKNVARVLTGLRAAGLDCPVIAIGDGDIRHRGLEFCDPRLQAVFAAPILTAGPPPRIIHVDAESPVSLFEEVVLPALVAELSLNRTEISIPTLAERAVQHLAIYGAHDRNRLVTKVDTASREIAKRDPDRFEYGSRTSSRQYAVMYLKKSPENSALQGRTQSYQAIMRTHRRSPRRKATAASNQVSLFDTLIDELLQPMSDKDEENTNNEGDDL